MTNVPRWAGSYEKAVLKAFNAGRSRYGTYGTGRRVCSEMRKHGHTASYKKVQRIMQSMGLHSIHRHCAKSLINSCAALAGKVSDNMRKELAIDTIKIAKKCRRLPHGTIFHSDRGRQYTAKETAALISRYGLRQSFSRVGKPGGNAWGESFFSMLKKKLTHHAKFKTRA